MLSVNVLKEGDLSVTTVPPELNELIRQAERLLDAGNV